MNKLVFEKEIIDDNDENDLEKLLNCSPDLADKLKASLVKLKKTSDEVTPIVIIKDLPNVCETLNDLVYAALSIGASLHKQNMIK